MISLKRVGLILLLVLTAGLLTACGDSKESSTTAENKPAPKVQAPAIDKMLLDAIDAGSKSKDEAGEFDMKLNVKGTSDNPQIKNLLETGLSAQVSGYAGTELIDLTGKVALGKQSMKFAAKGDKEKSFVGLDDVWYGPGPALDLNNVAQNPSLDSSTSLPKNEKETQEQIAKSKEVIQKYAKDVLTGNTTEGTQIAGQKTWVFEGTLSPEGLEKAVKQEDPQQKITEKDRRLMKLLSEVLKTKMTFGQNDKKLYGFSLNVDASQEQIKEMAEASGSQSAANQSFSLDASIDFQIKSYGKRDETNVEKPEGKVENYSMLQTALQQKLMALVMGSGIPMNENSQSTPQTQTTPDGSTTQTLPQDGSGTSTNSEPQSFPQDGSGTSSESNKLPQGEAGTKPQTLPAPAEEALPVG